MHPPQWLAEASGRANNSGCCCIKRENIHLWSPHAYTNLLHNLSGKEDKEPWRALRNNRSSQTQTHRLSTSFSRAANQTLLCVLVYAITERLCRWNMCRSPRTIGWAAAMNPNAHITISAVTVSSHPGLNIIWMRSSRLGSDRAQESSNIPKYSTFCGG